jgi:dihydroxyacid dehydratase/phosphogluconate dehydratase
LHGEDNGKVQTIGARFANGELSLQGARRAGCQACASSGGGCQFLGTAGTSQVVAEGLGLAIPTPRWRHQANRCGRKSPALPPVQRCN